MPSTSATHNLHIHADLQDFDHPGLSRIHLWDSKNLLFLRTFVPQVSDPENRALAESVLTDFENIVLPAAPQLPLCTVHHDVNDQNVLITKDGDGEYRISGVRNGGEGRGKRTRRVSELRMRADIDYRQMINAMWPRLDRFWRHGADVESA